MGNNKREREKERERERERVRERDMELKREKESVEWNSSLNGCRRNILAPHRKYNIV